MQNSKSNWLKAFEVHSPSTAHKHGPLINIHGRVRPSLSDHHTRLLLWILSANEEFYYQNAIYLSSRFKECPMKTNAVLNISRANLDWNNRLKEFRLLGSGTFGNVFLAKDSYTGEKLAVKEVGPISESTDNIIKEASNIMHERNDLLTANDSHFVVRFYAAFQDSFLKSYWLVFEFCIGSVKNYVDELRFESDILQELWNSRIIQSVYRTEMNENQLDVLTIAVVFLFEMCCGLDYLGQRSIVHNDIKPANILVSQTGHFKITDLGLTERLKWIDRKTTMYFLHPDLLKEGEEEDYQFSFRGTKIYTDPETQLHIPYLFNKKKVYEKLKSKFLPWKKPSQDFLTDLYSVGLTFLDVSLYGINPILQSILPKEIARRFDVHPDDSEAMKVWWLRNVYDDDVRENYLYAILDNIATKTTRNIMKFVKSIFLPRPIRAFDYTKELQVVKLKHVESRRCIDIDKVKEIDYFQTNRITQYNIFRFKMSPSLIKLFKADELEKREIVADKVDDLADKLTTERAEKLYRKTGHHVRMPCLDYQDVKFMT